MSRRSGAPHAFCSVRHDAWSAARATLPGRWSDELIRVDLDWWAEEVSRRARGQLYARKMPSDAELGREWGGVPRATVQRVVDAWARTLDEAHPVREMRGLRTRRFYHPPTGPVPVEVGEEGQEGAESAGVDEVHEERAGREQVASRSRAGQPAAYAENSPEASRSRAGREQVASRSGSDLSPIPARARADSPRAFHDPGSWIQDDDDARGRAREPVLDFLRRLDPEGASPAGREPPLAEDAALLVVRWAAESDHEDARRLRDEHRAGAVPARWSRAWLFEERVVETRLALARAWEAGGAPCARDALLEPAARRAADAAFAPWEAPVGWRWGAAAYATLCERADALEARHQEASTYAPGVRRTRGGSTRTSRETLAAFERLRAAGWRGHHPRPQRLAPEHHAAAGPVGEASMVDGPADPMVWAEAIWADVRARAQRAAQALPEVERAAVLDGLWESRPVESSGGAFVVAVASGLDEDWLREAAGPEFGAVFTCRTLTATATRPDSPTIRTAPHVAPELHSDPLVASVLERMERRARENRPREPRPAPSATPDVHPSPTAEDEVEPIRLPNGSVVPGDLTALLGLRNTHLARTLVQSHIETTEDLLVLDEQQRRYTPRTGAAFWRKVEAALPEGVALGCLSTTRAPGAGTGRPDYAAQMARLRDKLNHEGEPHAPIIDGVVIEGEDAGDPRGRHGDRGIRDAAGHAQ